MRQLLSKLLTSRKAVMTILGIITTYVLLPLLNGRLELGLDADQINEAIYPFIAYVIGQGMADFGKEGVPKVQKLERGQDPEFTSSELQID